MKNNKKYNRIKKAVESLANRDILTFSFSDMETWEVNVNALGFARDFSFSSDLVNFDKDNLTDEECVLQAIILQWEKENDSIEKTLNSVVAKVVYESNKVRGARK